MDTKKSKPWNVGDYVMYYSLVCKIVDIRQHNAKNNPWYLNRKNRQNFALYKMYKVEPVGNTYKKDYIIKWLMMSDFWISASVKRVSMASVVKRGLL